MLPLLLANLPLLTFDWPWMTWILWDSSMFTGIPMIMSSRIIPNANTSMLQGLLFAFKLSDKSLSSSCLHFLAFSKYYNTSGARYSSPVKCTGTISSQKKLQPQSMTFMSVRALYCMFKQIFVGVRSKWTVLASLKQCNVYATFKTNFLRIL